MNKRSDTITRETKLRKILLTYFFKQTKTCSAFSPTYRLPKPQRISLGLILLTYQVSDPHLIIQCLKELINARYTWVKAKHLTSSWNEHLCSLLHMTAAGLFGNNISVTTSQVMMNLGGLAIITSEFSVTDKK